MMDFGLMKLSCCFHSSASTGSRKAFLSTLSWQWMTFNEGYEMNFWTVSDGLTHMFIFNTVACVLPNMHVSVYQLLIVPMCVRMVLAFRLCAFGVSKASEPRRGTKCMICIDLRHVKCRCLTWNKPSVL